MKSTNRNINYLLGIHPIQVDLNVPVQHKFLFQLLFNSLIHKYPEKNNNDCTLLPTFWSTNSERGAI